MGGVSSAIGDATGQGGKGGFGAPQQSGGQPQMGFGFNPNTDMPFTGQAGQTLSDGLNSAFGGLPGVMPLVNTAGQVANTALGGLANGIQGNQPAPQPMPTSGMGGGKNSFLDERFINPVPTNPMFIDGNGNPTNDHGGGRVNMNINPFNPAYTQPQGPQIGFGFNPNTGGPLGGAINTATDASGQILNQLGMPQVGNAVSGLGGLANGIFGSLLGGTQPPQQLAPASQPVNRFAPPNAPGVRQQPRTAPRAGIPVQSARTVQPNRFTNTRTRLR